ncbi:hypothetical protein LHFGNBLO_002248 [Mesorhizobium sp. AR10]|uniref:hypothetical protein n=1 Tax=Mesorhizobium sp. AR10 TaxID=2865839 RepID=UPI00215FED21|nr:hypothetical protein [Mesorhizobium sp. AR10]UVK40736.1 hypothetical protein LHFGNBLO_002248 [Mesorhizobium sp. AR10]
MRAVIEFCDEKGVTHLGTRDLAMHIPCSKRAFRRALAGLEHLGLVSRLRRHDKRGTRYVIQILPITAMTSWANLVDSASRSR